MTPDLNPDPVREAAEALLDATAGLIPYSGQDTVRATPEEWATARLHWDELRVALSSTPEERPGTESERRCSCPTDFIRDTDPNCPMHGTQPSPPAQERGEARCPTCGGTPERPMSMKNDQGLIGMPCNNYAFHVEGREIDLLPPFHDVRAEEGGPAAVLNLRQLRDRTKSDHDRAILDDALALCESVAPQPEGVREGTREAIATELERRADEKDVLARAEEGATGEGWARLYRIERDALRQAAQLVRNFPEQEGETDG